MTAGSVTLSVSTTVFASAVFVSTTVEIIVVGETVGDPFALEVEPPSTATTEYDALLTRCSD